MNATSVAGLGQKLHDGQGARRDENLRHSGGEGSALSPPRQHPGDRFFDRERGVVELHRILGRLQGRHDAGAVPQVARLQVGAKGLDTR